MKLPKLPLSSPKLFTIKAKRLADHLRNPAHNNFKLIRLLCALLVIISHCYRDKDPIVWLTKGLFGGSGFAMPAFFFLSGLLVAQSLEYSSSRGNFLWKRFLRLYPAAVAAIILTACLIGPLVTTVPLRTYFTSPIFLRYLQTSLLVRIGFRLPGVFGGSPLGPSVNSSLWSLALEWKCYAGLFLLSFIRRKKAYLPLLLILLALAVLADAFYGPVESAGKDIFGSRFVLYPYSGLTAQFILGILTWQFRDRIIIRAWWPLAILLVGWIAAKFGVFIYAWYLLLPAILLYAAVTATSFLHRLTPRPDLSYGLYIWAFPIEQLTINYLHLSSPTSLFFATLLLTLPVALLSWYAIESPALRSKRRIK
jgi:peptidoglycan/LPS O-acetylase OafA/YrhL